MWIVSKYSTESIDNLLELLRKFRWGVRGVLREYYNYRIGLKMATIGRIETPHIQWIPLRTGVGSSDTILHSESPPTMKNANIPTHAYMIPKGMNAVELRFLADADGRVADAYVYATKKDDDIVLVCKVASVAGKQQATDGRYYIDTMTITDYWMKDIESADISAGDRVSRIAFDLLGYDKAFVLFDITSGTWGAEITGF